jgi:hypothetical protein
MSNFGRVVALVAACTMAPPVFAQAPVPGDSPQIQQAESLFMQGRQELERNNFAVACQRFRESIAVRPSISAQLNLGLCHGSMGKLGTALRDYRRAREMAVAASDKERAQAAAEAAVALETRVARVTLSVARPMFPLELWIDGERVAVQDDIPIDSGEHTIELRGPGSRPWSTRVTASDGARINVVVPALDLTVAAPGSTIDRRSDLRPGMRTAGWVAVGLGSAGLLFGAVSGAMAISAKRDADVACANDGDGFADVCSSPDGVSAHQRARSRASISTLGFAVGGSIAVVGVLLHVVARVKPTATRGSLELAPLIGTDRAGAHIAAVF